MSKKRKAADRAAVLAAKAAKKERRKATTTESNDPSSEVVFRESVEAIAVAILLALLFRGFEAEAFVIPTGSMAPTLQGAHKDVQCPECGYGYRAGTASIEQEGSFVTNAHCPICRHRMDIDPGIEAVHRSYTGDRILVNKFVYELTEPKRWDVIVFKFPGNAKQNYIKRLIGLPGETIRLQHGDVFVEADGKLEIQRKPVHKIPYMMHLVHDTRYIPQALLKLKWPARWF